MNQYKYLNDTKTRKRMSKAEKMLKEYDLENQDGRTYSVDATKSAMKAYAEKFGEWLKENNWRHYQSHMWSKETSGAIEVKSTTQLIEMFEQEV